MQYKLIPVLYTLVALLLLANCVREADFFQKNADKSTLVVSGVFTDGPGPHTIRLTRPGDSNKQSFEAVRNAVITLSDDAGNQYNYQEMVSADGEYWFYQLDNVQGMAGLTYTLEIKLPGGEVYRSKPEKMPVRVPIDSIQVRGEWFVSTNANGAIVQEPFAYVYAYSTAPAQSSGRYVRWNAETVHIFNELPKIYIPIPPPQKQCFITNRVSDQQVPLADLGIYQPGAAIYKNVGKKKIDNAFEHRICFSVYQHTTSRATYEYWEKISQLISPTGTIFDVPPSRVFGNVENIGDPGNPALGYFEVSAVDTARVYTRNGLLGSEFLLQDLPNCEYDWSKWPPVNYPECDNCLLIPASSLQKPDWWE
ncbi:MAG: DUF4249 domain-containing protein [Lewinellaceae bacterium]|nr:DUF4249 domain-containing protein [Lewinellaceae bacterium]